MLLPRLTTAPWTTCLNLEPNSFNSSKALDHDVWQQSAAQLADEVHTTSELTAQRNFTLRSYLGTTLQQTLEQWFHTCYLAVHLEGLLNSIAGPLPRIPDLVHLGKAH